MTGKSWPRDLPHLCSLSCLLKPVAHGATLLTEASRVFARGRAHPHQISQDLTQPDRASLTLEVGVVRLEQNGLRSALREFYPGALLAFGTDLDTGDAIAVLGHASTPAAGRRLRLSTLERLLRSGGRQRRVTARAVEIQTALRAPQLEAAAAVTNAYSVVVNTLVHIIGELNTHVTDLETELTSSFKRHAGVDIVESVPGLGPVLGARTLAEFGDDPARYADAKARKAYAGTAPITRASGTRHTVLARVARNRHLVNACFRWAYASLRGSPGARNYYDAHRARGQTHNQALRALANRLVGILHGCLANRRLYSEDLAWQSPQQLSA